MTDEIAGNYFEGLLAIGGLGLFGELLTTLRLKLTTEHTV